jgi:16S rRNA (adenine1518-N6/adenine1519-N6)-dimethyltransferase
VRAKKRFGQHFLHHKAILERITDALHPAPGDLVVEIGPGQGSLTEVLVRRGARVVAIEKDFELAPLLQVRLPEVMVIEADALEIDWRAAAGAGPDERLLVAGNIPYNITTPLIDRALAPPRPARIVFLVQKEVAERIVAPAGHEAYGALSVGVQAVAKAEKLFPVPAGAFHPPPKVDSAVIRLTPLDVPLVPDADIQGFRRLVVGMFSFRRKQLVRGLRELTAWTPDQVRPVIERAALDGGARPEAVPPIGFVRLHRALVDAGWTPR